MKTNLEKELDDLEKRLNEAHKKYKQDKNFRADYLRLSEEYRKLYNKYTEQLYKEDKNEGY